MPNICDTDLPKTAANHAPLSPLAFIDRGAEVYPNRLALANGTVFFQLHIAGHDVHDIGYV